MSDLISRKAVLQKLEGKNSYSVNTATTEQIMKSYAYADCICIIEHETTAFDVDKVVEQLEEARDELLHSTDYNNDIINYCLDWFDMAIDIVKGAVKE